MPKFLIFIFIVLSGFTVIGAENSITSAESFAQLLSKGGPIMLPLYALSFIGLCLIFYYTFTLRIELFAPKDFINKAENALIDQDYELLEGICNDSGCMLSGILESGVTLAKKSKNHPLIKDLIEDEGARQGSLLWQRIHYLYDIAVIAPMLGLLGTVLGMMKSFIGLQAESAIPQQTQITSGISMALITTAAGLVIGIVAMIIYSYFRGRLTRLIAELEYRCNKILILMNDIK
jgi:biopolymer transport protein ExbB